MKLNRKLLPSEGTRVYILLLGLEEVGEQEDEGEDTTSRKQLESEGGKEERHAWEVVNLLDHLVGEMECQRSGQTLTTL